MKTNQRMLPAIFIYFMLISIATSRLTACFMALQQKQPLVRKLAAWFWSRLKPAVDVIAILVLTTLLLGAYTVSHAQSPQLADQYWRQAQAAQKNGRYLEAVQSYEKSAEAEQNSPNPRLGNLSNELNNAGFCYWQTGQYDKAIKYYEESLAITKKLGNEDQIAIRLNNIGNVYDSWGQYDEAIKNYEEALAIAKKLGQEDRVALRLNNIGQVYFSWGQYDKALKYYEEALAIDRKLDKEDLVAINLNNIGQVYKAWGQYDKAIKNYEVALAIAKKLGQEDKVALRLNNIGQVYSSWGQYDKAIKNYEVALAIAKKLGQEDKVALYLNNIGQLYSSWGQYDKALKYYEEALATAKKLGQEDKVALRLNNIGTVYNSWGQYDKAIKNYEEALAIAKKLGQEDKVALYLSNIGFNYYSLGQYDKAVDSFNASITLKEKLRKTATGVARRDYLASQIGTYQLLISSYTRNNDPPNVFSAMENSRAKLLAERLAGSDSMPAIPSVRLLQQEMPSDTAIISFANTRWDNQAVLIITKDNLAAVELDKKKFLDSIRGTYQRPIEQLLAQQRGLRVVNKSAEGDQKPQDKAATSFDDVVNYYRSLLTDTSSGINRSGRGLVVAGKHDDPRSAARLDRLLHDFLIQPLARELKGKKRLIIIPDGVLAYIPFETLMDENNSYLVEKYVISYTQSMGIMEMLKKRTYPTGQKSMIAFGGAVYDEVSYAGDMINNEQQLLALANDVYATTRSKGALGPAYSSLGIAKWDNLPGTLNEVEAIAKTVHGAEVVTGRNVTESRVKQLSASGELTKYKVIHFATHGIVVPQIPELSAIVLSQIKNQPGGEDGYLRMDKIEGLRMNAEFVNLSACETGLGKIFGGEGVVGLTQSFLLAGANGLSASLWSVNDVSTSQFMVALYSIAEQRKIGYADAITEIKRSFIQGKFGEAYKSPYYWAPFVYYGK